MKNILIYTTILLFLSCNRNSDMITNEKLNILLSENISKYHKTKDKKYLIFVYEKLSKNDDFKNHGLVGKNSLPIISLLLNLKKYDELEKLLANNTAINKYNRINTLNTVKYLKFKNNNIEKANSYIKESTKMIIDSLQKSPNDSLLYADYFSMRVFLVGKEKVLKEIDSMQIVNKKYSDLFYKDILRSSIENYQD